MLCIFSVDFYKKRNQKIASLFTPIVYGFRGDLLYDDKPADSSIYLLR